MTTIGIIGVGFLGECLAEGLARAGARLIISPRNAERAARLQKRFGCIVAPDNAGVVASAGIVLLATRPGDIAATASGLPWRADQMCVSVAAGVRLETIRQAVAPAKAFRSMPISASAIGESPTAFCPGHPAVAELFGRIGRAHPIDDETVFESASIYGAFYALVYAFLDEAAGWGERHGLDPAAARELTAGLARAAAANVIENSARSPGDLLGHLMTPGGITEEGLDVLRECDALSPWSAALSAALAKARSIDPDPEA